MNERLIRAYKACATTLQTVIRLLKQYPHDAKFFYRFRETEIGP